MAIGIVGDAGVRANAQQPKLFVGMILILIFAEALALYGLIGALRSRAEAWRASLSAAVQPYQHALHPLALMPGFECVFALLCSRHHPGLQGRHGLSDERLMRACARPMHAMCASLPAHSTALLDAVWHGTVAHGVWCGLVQPADQPSGSVSTPLGSVAQLLSGRSSGLAAQRGAAAALGERCRLDKRHTQLAAAHHSSSHHTHTHTYTYHTRGN